jgi:hypothetical protein
MTSARVRARARARARREATAAAEAEAKVVKVVPELNKMYSLAESLQFENNPDVKIVYMTENGIDLYAVDADFRMIDYANRNGNSWYHMMYASSASTKKHVPKKHVCIVKTTVDELDTYMSAKQNMQKSVAQMDHTMNIFAKINELPAIEKTMDTIVNIIVDYMSVNNFTDFEMSDKICEYVVRKNILVTPTQTQSNLLPASPHSESDSDDSQRTLVNESEHVPYPYDAITSIYPEFISGWIVTTLDSLCTSIETIKLAILPIPGTEATFIESY